jgi:hypothetical protein
MSTGTFLLRNKLRTKVLILSVVFVSDGCLYFLQLSSTSCVCEVVGVLPLKFGTWKCKNCYSYSMYEVWL